MSIKRKIVFFCGRWSTAGRVCCVEGDFCFDLPTLLRAVFKYHLWSPTLVIFSNCGQKKLTKGLCVRFRSKW